MQANSLSVATFALRHMAAIAKRRNAYNLMSTVVHACQEKGIDLKHVLEWKEDNQDGDLCVSTHPFEVLQVVSQAQGYCLARTLGPNGTNAFFNNAAFEHDIMSLEACNSAYEQNEREVISHFVHPDDIAAMHVS